MSEKQMGDNIHKGMVSHTIFHKKQEISIEDVHVGDIVFLRVWCALNSKQRIWECWGKVNKKTSCYLDVVYYIETWYSVPNYCSTDHIIDVNQHSDCFTKRWLKRNIVELYLADTEEKIVEIGFTPLKP